MEENNLKKEELKRRWEVREGLVPKIIDLLKKVNEGTDWGTYFIWLKKNRKKDLRYVIIEGCQEEGGWDERITLMIDR